MKRWGHNSKSSWERPGIADQYSLAVAFLDTGDLSILRGVLHEQYGFASGRQFLRMDWRKGSSQSLSSGADPAHALHMFYTTECKHLASVLSVS